MSSPENLPIRGKVAYPLDSQPDLERSFVGRIAQSLYPRDPCGRLFMMLTAYYDESGTHAGSPMTVLAGFVGDTNDWVDLEIEWAKVMKAHKITHVRAKHLFHHQGQHKNWNDDQVDDLVAAILYVMQERKQIFASKTILPEHDYKKFYVGNGPRKKERLDTRYALCLRSFLNFLPEAHARNGCHRINFVLESGHKNAGDALRVFDEVRKDKKFPWRDIIGSLSFGAKQDSGALQAADFLAYLTYQEQFEAIKEGYPRTLILDGTGIDSELVWGCGLTVLDNIIAPKDLTIMRQNFRMKHKRRVFGKALLDGGFEVVEPASEYVQYAAMRSPLRG